MTNPDNIVRVRARNGGRASVYEANGWCQAYGSGILDGTGVVQNTVANMTVLVGGSSSKPDVLIAQNPAGYKIALDLVVQQPVTITAPASNSRISAIVAYTDDLALESTEDTVTGSPASCGLIVVNGSSSASPSAPTDTQIRNAITSDGATGSQASYAIIATIKVASNTTSITDALITRNQAGVQSSKIDFKTLSGNYSLEEQDTGFTWVDGSTIYKKTISIGTLPNATTKSVAHGISNLGNVVKIEGWAYSSYDGFHFPLPFASTVSNNESIQVFAGNQNIIVSTGVNRTAFISYITLYYTKSS
jgi:hypothetical protein